MNIDLINGGILSWIMPIILFVFGIMALSQLFRGQVFAMLPPLITAVIAMVGFTFYSSWHDAQAVQSAVSEHYSLTISEDQAKALQADHSYRRHEPDLTISTTQGVAEPHGTINVSLHGVKQRVMMYKTNGKWYVGSVPAASAADQKVRELPVSNAIPSLN